MTRRARTLQEMAAARRRERETAALMAQWAAEQEAKQAERDRAHAAAAPPPPPAPPVPTAPPPPTRHPASRITIAEAVRRITLARRDRDAEAERKTWALVHQSEHRAIRDALPRRTRGA